MSCGDFAINEEERRMELSARDKVHIFTCLKLVLGRGKFQPVHRRQVTEINERLLNSFTDDDLNVLAEMQRECQ